MSNKELKTIAWQCGFCSRPTEITIIGDWEDSPKFGAEYDPYKWITGHCAVCMHAYVFTQEYDWLTGYEESQLLQVFPETARTLPTFVPIQIRAAFDEAQRCLSVNAHSAVSLLARKIVEGVCDELKANGNSLAAKLENLRNDGKLDEKLYYWSSLIRQLGNRGAHESANMITREDAQDALQFVEALVDYQYVFQAKYHNFVLRQVPPQKKFPIG